MLLFAYCRGVALRDVSCKQRQRIKAAKTYAGDVVIDPPFICRSMSFSPSLVRVIATYDQAAELGHTWLRTCRGRETWPSSSPGHASLLCHIAQVVHESDAGADPNLLFHATFADACGIRHI